VISAIPSAFGQKLEDGTTNAIILILTRLTTRRSHRIDCIIIGEVLCHKSTLSCWRRTTSCLKLSLWIDRARAEHGNLQGEYAPPRERSGLEN